MSDSSDTDRYLSRVAGAQLALMLATQVLLQKHRGDPAMTASLSSGIEAMHALLLASPAGDQKLAGFEETAEELLKMLRG